MVTACVGPLPDRLAGLGVLLLGLGWGFGTLIAHHEAIAASGVPLASAFALVVGGAVGSVAAIWFGVGAVAWAMARALGARAPFGGILWSVSAASPPLWVASPAAAIVAAGPAQSAMVPLVAVCAVAAIAFVALLVGRLRAMAGLSTLRAWACIGLVVSFCASVLSLSA